MGSYSKSKERGKYFSLTMMNGLKIYLVINVVKMNFYIITYHLCKIILICHLKNDQNIGENNF